ncbi:14056_t:CDS:2, partial [Racocetra persica]
RADAYLENNEQVKKIIAECHYLNEKYPTLEAKGEVQELILTSITETLAGGELNLTAFSNLEKDNLPAPYQLDLTLLLNPSTFPYPELESSLLSIYFPTNQDITDGQMIKTTLANNPEMRSIENTSIVEDQSKENLAFKATIDYQNGEYIIQVQYHSQSPFSKEISELVIVAPLRFEIENLKQKQEQLPTSENFEKLTKQNQL